MNRGNGTSITVLSLGLGRISSGFSIGVTFELININFFFHRVIHTVTLLYLERVTNIRKNQNVTKMGQEGDEKVAKVGLRDEMLQPEHKWERNYLGL